ncbi:MAG: Uma2 family endonuclease [Gemmataceae bacterium]
MSTTVAVITPEDLLQMPDEGKGHELVNGEVKELPVSTESSRVAGEVYFQLRLHCAANPIAWVFPEGTSFRCFPDDERRVRRPDTSVILLERMPLATYEDEGHCTTRPDLAVEVISPNDLAGAVEDKLAEWLDAGVKVVWVVNPTTRSVRVHGPSGYRFLRAADTLTAPEVLPGFSCPVAELFRRPGEPVAPTT